VAKEVLGSERRVDLRASARLSRASAYLAIKGRLGGGDRLDALVDIDKNRNRLDLALDYAAPRGGCWPRSPIRRWTAARISAGAAHGAHGTAT
jgi:hypothetical protein